MEIFLITLLRCTISMSIITLLYGLLLPILSKRYSPRWRYMVWLVIAVGWLIPFRPPIELPFLPSQSTNTPFIPVQLTPASTAINTPMGVSHVASETIANMTQLSIWTVGIFVWLGGIIIMLIYHILRHRRFLKMVNRWSEAVTTPQILDLLDVMKQEQNIKASIEYKTCPNISSPMLVGFFRPVILMPPIQLSENELTLILRHELAHFKRHDLWYKTVVLAATILHWFNPMVYFMARATSVQCEIACDALVLQNEGIQIRKQYGETIIAVVRGGRTHQTALSTDFYGGKQGMKNRIVSILDNKCKKSGIAVLCIVLIGIILTGATLVSATNQATSIPNTAFTEEEYAKLLDLRFNGYEDMSVSKFQQKVWQATDTPEYMALLEQFYNDNHLNDMKDTNEIASFLFYELTPLMAESWNSRDFGNGSMVNNENTANTAQFEYTCTLNITDATNLTVGEYSCARKAVMDGIMTFFQSRSEEELQNEAHMKKAIEAEINTLTKQWSNDALTIRVDYFFIPLEVYNNYESTEKGDDNDVEEREYPNGNEEDYRSLLKLKTVNYQSRTLKDFNEDLLEWANADYDRSQRIGIDTVFNDFTVSLTPTEFTFITLTVNYSSLENATMIKSSYTKAPKGDIVFSDNLPEKTLDQEKVEMLVCSLYYQGSYHITDESRMTVGERDHCISSAVNDIQKFWRETNIEELLTMNEEDILEKLQNIATQYSNDQITISIIPNQVAFNKMDEQSSRN